MNNARIYFNNAVRPEPSTSSGQGTLRVSKGICHVLHDYAVLRYLSTSGFHSFQKFPGRFQRGFTLVGTVFMITVLAALAAFLVTITGTQQAAALYSLQGARAYAAAQSGIEWATRQAVVAGSCVAGPTTITPALGAPGNFTITVTCTATSVTEGAKTYNVYNLTSTATTGSAATADLITRTVQASVTNG